MHKYMPRLNIVEVSSRVSDSASSKTSSSLKHTFTFPETQFIAVTAYQNTDVSLFETYMKSLKNLMNWI